MSNFQDAIGAMKSLNATIDEISRYLDGDERARHGEIRSRLNAKLAEMTEWWFQEGFSLAHKICLEKAKSGESFDHIDFSSKDVWLAPGEEKSVELSSPLENRPDPSWNI